VVCVNCGEAQLQTSISNKRKPRQNDGVNKPKKVVRGGNFDLRIIIPEVAGLFGLNDNDTATWSLRGNVFKLQCLYDLTVRLKEMLVSCDDRHDIFREYADCFHMHFSCIDYLEFGDEHKMPVILDLLFSY
jgi:hypothetical protein